MAQEYEKITIGQIKLLQQEISKYKTIGEWKKVVKAFATKYKLTDREAINIAKMEPIK